MRFSPFILFISTFFLIIQSLYAQDSSRARLYGSVKSASGETLPAVTLLLKGTSQGVMTDVNGFFEIEDIEPSKYTLQIWYLGYESQEKTISLRAGQNLELDVVMKEKTEDLESVTLLGKSTTALIRQQAYLVSAISAEALYNSTSDAQQMLDRVPGVRILEDGGLGSDTNFTLNGFSGDQVRFFIDGIPMDHFGSALGLSSISVNSIERIEVYKGVVPVWLGTDALGGAVNIITKRGANFLDASYSLGSFNTHRVSANGAYTKAESGFTFRGNINYNYSDNNYEVWVPISRENAIVDTAEVERFHDRYRSASARIETGVVERKYADQLLLSIMAATDEKEVQHGATMNSVYGGIVNNSESLIAALKYSKRDIFIQGLDLSLYNAFNITKSEVIDTLRGVTYNWLGEPEYTHGSENGELRRTFLTIDDRDLSSRLNAGYAFSEGHAVALNYSLSAFSRETFDAENPERVENFFPKSLVKHVAGLAYKFDPSTAWSTTLFGKFYAITAEGSKQYDFGLSTQRTDSFRDSESSMGYGVASSYFLLPGLQVKASYEHTYRMPTATEMFGDGLFISPNPELGPEKSNNLNIGAGYEFLAWKKHYFSLGSSFIYRDAEDLIYQVVTVASPQTRFDNLSETRTLGVEANFDYEWGELLSLGGNITYQDITDQADFVYNDSYTNSGYQRNYQKGFRLPNTPYFFGNARAGLNFEDPFLEEDFLGITYRYNYVREYFLSWAELGSRDSKKIIPTQSSHDLEFSYSLGDGKYNLSLEVRNLTDARLYDKYFLQKPGRAIYMKIRYVL